MDTWVEQVNKRARILIDQIVAARAAATESNTDLAWLETQYRNLLEELYAQEYATARLRDTSDLVIRAEGPGAEHDGPTLQSFNWLADHVRRQLGKLSEAVLPLRLNESKAINRKLGWIFTGYAPGSITMGFALKNPTPIVGFERADAEAFDIVRAAAQSVASVPQFVGDTELNTGLTEQIIDPALRDAAIIAAWQLSPTPKSGIHTVEIASRNGDHGSLSQRERMVLKKSVISPLFRKSQLGTFVGNVRAADLDKHRLVLRDVEGVGSIRCAISPGLSAGMQKYFGSHVLVHGRYEADRDGRPRMMRIDSIQQVEEPHTLSFVPSLPKPPVS
jgi:hypothetical protein